MPYYRRRYKRRNKKYSKRRTIKRYLRKKAKKGNLTVCKLRLGANLDAAAITGTIDSYATLTNPSACTDWTAYATLYDSYRVYAFKLQYYPDAPFDASATTSYFPLYTVIDYDATSSPLTSVDTALQYENCKNYNLYRPWKRYCRVPKYMSTTTATTILPGGFVDLASPISSGVLAFYGTGFTPSKRYGKLVYTYYVGFKNRR